jgi:hypothetical protein
MSLPFLVDLMPGIRQAIRWRALSKKVFARIILATTLSIVTISGLCYDFSGED